MSKIKVSTLTGPLLDLWVAKVEGKEVYVHNGYCFIVASQRNWRENPSGRYSPSTDWSRGGPIIERELRPLVPYDGEKSAEGIWRAGDVYKCQLKGMGFVGEGRTILEAAMRTFVGDKFGEEVDE